MFPILLGCDPELFIEDKGGRYVSAFGILPGTKSEPYEVECGAVQVDGTAFEFNIKPAKTEEEWEKNIRTVLVQMDNMIKKIDKNFKLTCIPVAFFDEKYFEQLPEEAKLLGCDPDYSCYSGGQQVPPEELKDAPFRTASGHVHIGWTEGVKPHHPMHFGECQRVAFNFKNEGLYAARTLLEKKRAKYYGLNSAFRPKSYGVELRAPSNRWVQHESTRRRMYRETFNRYNLIKR